MTFMLSIAPGQARVRAMSGLRYLPGCCWEEAVLDGPSSPQGAAQEYRPPKRVKVSYCHLRVQAIVSHAFYVAVIPDPAQIIITDRDLIEVQT